jgi:hypothetical protein
MLRTLLRELIMEWAQRVPREKPSKLRLYESMAINEN